MAPAGWPVVTAAEASFDDEALRQLTTGAAAAAAGVGVGFPTKGSLLLWDMEELFICDSEDFGGCMLCVARAAVAAVPEDKSFRLNKTTAKNYFICKY